MFEPPKTINEYLRRAVTVPWVVAGATTILFLGAIAYVTLIKSPPEDQGRHTKTDLRYVYAGVSAAFMVGFLVWVPVATKNRVILARRGKFAPATKVLLTPVSKSGATPVRVSYEVDGVSYTVAEDMPTGSAHETHDAIHDVMVIYDPQKPSRAMILPPPIARLPLE